MRAELSVDLPITRIAVFAEMAWLERRPELGLLCRAALAGDGRLSVAGVQTVLPGLSDVGARNVIAWCRALALCDERGGLSRLAEDVAEDDEAPVPEQGVYDVWLVHHPLFGERMLAVERLTSARQQQRELIELPMTLAPGEVFTSVTDPAQRFQLRSFPSNSGSVQCVIRQTRASCRLQWTIDFAAERNQWRLDGRIEVLRAKGGEELVPILHEPETVTLDVWGLMRHWALGPLAEIGRWSPEERRLAIPLANLNNEEAEHFCKTLKFDGVEVPGKGRFTDATLFDTPIGPLSDSEAQRWAVARLERRLDGKPPYRSRAAVRQLFAELTEDTPLESLKPELPTHEQLLATPAGTKPTHPARYWSLVAAVDLAPYPVAAEELGGLRIGSPVPTGMRDSAQDHFRVSYRSGWSMRELIERLLAGTRPSRVLLCDRYVCGQDNLATLRLFVGALRHVDPQLGLDVWTEAETDVEAICEITGVRPHSYEQMFGRRAPHDRYVLVDVRGGTGFGWHMTNSPLHARADMADAALQSPLRWKDLAGIRVPINQLEPPMRAWFQGGRR